MLLSVCFQRPSFDAFIIELVYTRSTYLTSGRFMRSNIFFDGRMSVDKSVVNKLKNMIYSVIRRHMKVKSFKNV